MPFRDSSSVTVFVHSFSGEMKVTRCTVDGVQYMVYSTRCTVHGVQVLVISCPGVLQQKYSAD